MSLLFDPRDTLWSHLTADPQQNTGTKRMITEFDMQVTMIPHKNRFEYHSPADLIEKIRATIDSGSAEEYFLYFHGVTHDNLPELDREFFLSRLDCTLDFTTENGSRGLICRILPGWKHGMLTLNLWVEIMDKIREMPGHSRYSIRSFGGTRFDLTDIRSKEGHQALGPATRGAKNVWPSVVIEVGYSEALDFLRLDAEWWLHHSNGAIRFVILVQLMTDPLAIRIECWGLAPPIHLMAQQTPIRLPSRLQEFDIDADGVVKSTSNELCIPYSAIFDEPNKNAPDVVFTDEELSSFALRMFDEMKY